MTLDPAVLGRELADSTQPGSHESVRVCLDLLRAIPAGLKGDAVEQAPSREIALAITSLQEAGFWLREHLERTGGLQVGPLMTPEAIKSAFTEIREEMAAPTADVAGDHQASEDADDDPTEPDPPEQED